MECFEAIISNRIILTMKSIVFATNNAHKVAEIQPAVAGLFEIKRLAEINCFEEIPETTATIEGNAIQKAQYVYDNYHVNCFAEDTGLEVYALNGEPGVHTAYYAGPERDAKANMQLVLRKLQSHEDRRARFKTVIALIEQGTIKTFTGIIEGTIALAPQGEGGFGYDPIFIPEHSQQTFAQMDTTEKNVISHRARAVAQLKRYFLDLSK